MFRDRFLSDNLNSEENYGNIHQELNEEHFSSTTFHPSTFTIQHWDRSHSHSRLQISNDQHIIHRNDHFELYPIAIARTSGALNICFCKVIFERKITKDFSITN